MADDDFSLWLARIGGDRPFMHRVIAGANRAGRLTRGLGARSKFTGARIGRGAGVGRVLAAGAFSRAASRRVVVKASIVRLADKGAGGAVAHLRYLQRDGTTREGERGSLYGPETDAADGKAFTARGSGDRHQFRFIVAPEDGAEYEDLKPLIRRWMSQAEQDLGTRLDWVAVDHFNTGHPHSHVIVRGKDDRGKDLIIAREYLTQGLRARAIDLVDLDLGPRSEREIMRAQQNEIGNERLSGIDRRLIASADAENLVRAVHRDGVEQSLRAGRLQTLARMGLAVETGRGSFRLDPELATTLIRMGERGDIIRTMQRELSARLPERSPADHTVYRPERAGIAPLIGRVVTRGLADEHADRHYLIVDGIDGRSHYVDIGIGAGTEPLPEDSVVRISLTPVSVREVDRTIAAVAAANGGRYDVDAHLRHDPTATERFAETHVRRLEAIRRGTGGASDPTAVEREPNGRWTIAPDHLARVETYERHRAERRPVVIDTLSARPVAALARHDGVTWLDREIVADKPVALERGFGAEVRQAQGARRQWLVEQQLAEVDGDAVRVRANLLATLQQRELRNVAGQLSDELGLAFTEARSGQAVEGIYRRAVAVGDAKFALIEKAREFTLVPWRPVLERGIGKPVSGIDRDGGISWTIGRSRGLGIS